MDQPKATRITGFALAVRDPAASLRFYCEGLGFAADAASGHDHRVRLGEVTVELVEAEAGLAPPASANAPDFQHFAIRVRDMAAAFRHLAPAAPTPISRGGPQALPPADGCVSAWKFRDPDGHPLELLHDPAAAAPAGAPLFMAVDHTAVACADVAASLAFYARLGFAPGPSSHNTGPPQDRLDGLTGVDLRIATVHLPGAGPHVELLHYLRPPPPGRRAIGAGQPFLRTRMAATREEARLADPVGHLLELTPPPPGTAS